MLEQIEMEVMTMTKTRSRLLTTSEPVTLTINRHTLKTKIPPLSSLLGCFPTSSACWYNHSPCRLWAAKHGWGCRTSQSLLGNAFLLSAESSFLINSYSHSITPHCSNDYTVLTQTEKQLLSTSSLHREKNEGEVGMTRYCPFPDAHALLIFDISFPLPHFLFSSEHDTETSSFTGFWRQKAIRTASESDPFIQLMASFHEMEMYHMYSTPSSGAAWGSTCSLLTSDTYLRFLLAQGSL